MSAMSMAIDRLRIKIFGAKSRDLQAITVSVEDLDQLFLYAESLEKQIDAVDTARVGQSGSGS